MDYFTYRWTNHGRTIYTTHTSKDLAHFGISRAIVAKGGIKTYKCTPTRYIAENATMNIFLFFLFSY